MDVKAFPTKENFSWKLLNEVLADITGTQNYQFNSKAIMMDENRSNFCGVREVFAMVFVISRVVSCQMHYKSDVHKVSAEVVGSSIAEFKKIIVVATIPECNE